MILAGQEINLVQNIHPWKIIKKNSKYLYKLYSDILWLALVGRQMFAW